MTSGSEFHHSGRISSSLHGLTDGLPFGLDNLPEPRTIVQANLERRAGLLLPVFGLPHESNLGGGNLNGLRDSIDFSLELGLSLGQILPVNETGGDNCPYLPLCSMALEPSLLSPLAKDVPGLTQGDFNQLAPNRFTQQFKRNSSVDYPLAKGLTLALHQQAFWNFVERDLKNDTRLAKEFREFCETEGPRWLDDYTLFRTCMELNNNDARWQLWPETMRTPQAAANLLSNDVTAQERRLFFAYRQWVGYRQWGELKDYASSRNFRIAGDVSFGISLHSADVWANQHLFEMHLSLGAPAEGAFQGSDFARRWGQNWGARAYAWREHIMSDFAWWKCRIEQTLRCCHDIRFDHALGPFRSYTFPWDPHDNHIYSQLSREEAASRTGGRLPAYMPYADDHPNGKDYNARLGKLFFSKLLEAAAPHGAKIIAEDVGASVPEYVTDSLTELNIPGMKLIGIEKEYGRNEFVHPSALPSQKVVYFGTHDHEPARARIEGIVRKAHNSEYDYQEYKSMLKLAGISAESMNSVETPEIQRRMIEQLLASPANYVIINVLDILHSKKLWNDPSGQHESWALLLKKSLQDFAKDPEINRTYKKIAATIALEGR